MNRVITIRLEVPDGVDVRIDGNRADYPTEPLPPPIGWDEPDDLEPVFRPVAVGRNGDAFGSCPVHGLGWKMVPAGVSRKTGRPYDSFSVCPAPGCDRRPPTPRRAAS